MLSQARRSLFARVSLGTLAAGAALSLSACGLPILPPAFQDAGEEPSSSPEPIEVEETESEEPVPLETEEPEGLGPEDQDVLVLREGDCINEWTADEDDMVSTVPKIDCAEPHDLEVYYEGVLEESGAYPGEAEVMDMVDEGCDEAFEDFVGVAQEDSSLVVSTLFATEEGWAQGDRGYLCLVGQATEQTTGTLEDSGI
ncbi:septum formation family protein [Nocardiopsis alkaliphila]|uniref:septum formation family protein n=1 Tax=Nocardiopsis alkaliphila TaxID=225762 RepID=UPI0003486FDF|nr:septum formation family protein [Nocardiopsis alkaliphila]